MLTIPHYFTTKTSYFTLEWRRLKLIITLQQFSALTVLIWYLSVECQNVSSSGLD